jgi:acyl-CoA thioester hydrolase
MARSDFKFSFPFRVRYSEIDGQQIVFNAHYLTYFDTAITEYFRALPHDYKAMADETGMDFHTVKSLVEYKKMISFDEEIDVCVRVGRIGRSSLRFDLEIHGRDIDDLRATGEIVWVHTNQSTHTTEAVPSDLRDKIIALDGEAMDG